MVHAGALVNSLAAANQEVPKALMDLASRDSRFRKGLGSTGSATRGRGRGGAGRGRSQVRTFHSNRHCCLLLHRRRPARCIIALILRMLIFEAVALTESETHFQGLHHKTRSCQGPTLLQVGGAGLGFGTHSLGGPSNAMPTSAAGIARAPAEQKTAAALEAGFARGGLESTIEGTLPSSVPAPAPAAPAPEAAPAPSEEPAVPVQQVESVW